MLKTKEILPHFLSCWLRDMIRVSLGFRWLYSFLFFVFAFGCLDNLCMHMHPMYLSCSVIFNKVLLAHQNKFVGFPYSRLSTILSNRFVLLMCQLLSSFFYFFLLSFGVTGSFPDILTFQETFSLSPQNFMLSCPDMEHTVSFLWLL